MSALAPHRWATAVFVAGALAASGCWFGCSVQQEIFLRCTYDDKVEDVYSLNAKAGVAGLMSVNPPRPGSLTATDSHYQLTFAEDHPAPGYMQLKISINRLTSKAEREIGRDITVMHEGAPLELQVIKSSGTCVPMKGPAF